MVYMAIPLLRVTAEFFPFNRGFFRRAGEFISGTAEIRPPSSVCSAAQHIISDRLGHAVEDLPIPIAATRKPTMGVAASMRRADAAEDRFGMGGEEAPIVASIAATIAINDGTSAKGCRHPAF